MQAVLSNRRVARKNRGFTLTEIAIVLGIIGLILGAVWVAASAVYKNMRVATASKELLTIAQGIRSTLATQNQVDTATGTDVTNAFLVAHVFPTDMLDNVTSPTVAYSPWQGLVAGSTSNVTVTSYTANSSTLAGNAFAISFNNLPKDACVDMLVRNSGSGRDAGLVGAGTAASSSTTFPITPTQAVAACAAASQNVVFTFLLKS